VRESSIINRVRQAYSKLDRHSLELLRGSVFGFGSRLAAAATVFIFNVVLARMLGADQMGLYFLGIATITVVAVFSRLGIDIAILRFSSAHIARKEWPDVAALYWHSNKRILLSSCVLAVLLYAGSPWLANAVFSKPQLAPVLANLAIALPFVALIPLQSRFLQSAKQVGAVLYTQNALIPTMLLAALLILPFDWDVETVTASYAVAALGALFICIALWIRCVPILGQNSTVYDFTALNRSSRALFPASIVNKVLQPWAAVLFLGFWGSAAEVGWFGTATRTAALIAFAIVPVNTILAPKMAVMANEGDLGGLFRLARNATALIILIAIPIVCPILIAPNYVMSIFGEGFSGAGQLLVVLALGQIVNVLTGPVQSILVMTGNEDAHRTASLIGGCVTLALCIFLIPLYGAIGAAWTSTCGFAITNIVSSALVWKRVWNKIQHAG
jgi:O-antigen/teichoic acid export membrane protein